MSAIPEWFFLLAVALFGLLFGSLANVIIWRVPRRESIVAPGSHCPQCDSAIAWYDNIPVVSWLLLRARCRRCGAHISARYPIVEVLSGILWLVAALRWEMSLRTAFGIALFYLLLVLTYIDLDHMRLPNVIVGVLAAVGLVGVVIAQASGTAVVPFFEGAGALASPLAYAGVGLLAGGGLSALMAATYAVIRKSAGLGMGDIKLLGVLGIFFGPYVLMVLLFASIIGAVVGLASARVSKDRGPAKIPFGPFLAAGAVAVALCGPAVWTWYLGVAGLR